MPKQELTPQSCVHFSWDFGATFLLQSGPKSETGDPMGTDYWIWSDPEYGGDNTIRRVPKAPDRQEVPVWRDKGWHLVWKYCGLHVKILTP